MRTTLIKIIFIIVAVATVGLLAYIFVSPEVDGASMHESTINNVRTMARLQSMEIYDEVPVKGSIGSRHLVGRLRVRGNVGFDIDKLDADLSADTVRLYLPAEVIDVYESTDPGSYIVFDTWNDALFGKSNFTTAEENSIKAKVKANWIKRLYANGTVARARAEATGNLQSMLSLTLGKPVVVSDSTPRGARYKEIIKPKSAFESNTQK